MNQTKIALVTGAARRTGAAIVRHLHQAGFRVIIHYHTSAAKAQALAASLNQQRADSAYSIKADLCDPEAAQTVISAALHWGGRLDVLVNNASVFIRDRGALAAWDTLFTTNVKAPFLLSQAAYPALAAQEGVIINITDIHAVKPLGDYSVYCQSKAALAMQTRSLAKSLAPFVRVNAVAPGAIAWPEGENSLSEELQEKIISQTLLKRHGHPENIARAVLALIENTFITGQILAVDGGRSIS